MIRYEVTARWIPEGFAPYAFQTYKFKFPEDYEKLILFCYCILINPKYQLVKIKKTY